jgi:hypothetical protein
MDAFNPFSLRYHNRDGGTSAAPIRRVPVGDQGEEILEGDPVQVEGGVAAEYNAGDGVFGVALYDFPDYVANGTKDRPQLNHPLVHPVEGDSIAYRVQAKNLESDVAVAVSQTVLGNTYDLAGDAGEMYLDVSAAGTDFLVIDIESTVSEWDDLYPILIVKCVNSQDEDPTP